MPDSPIQDPILSLRFLPDWLKDTSPPVRHYDDLEAEDFEAEHEGRHTMARGQVPERKEKTRQSKKSRPRREGDRSASMPDAQDKARRAPHGGDHRPRPHGSAMASSSPHSTKLARSTGNRRERRHDERSDFRPHSRATAHAGPSVPVDVSFHPPRAMCESILRQIKTTSLAYPLFRIAKLFLEQPERHLVRLRMREGTLVRALPAGPVGTSREALARALFDAHFSDYYQTTIEECEEIKGNYTSVARCGLSGQLLGPTNHHSYQTSLRSLYTERYAAQMSFENYRSKVTVMSDPDLVQQWKDQIRKRERYVFSPPAPSHPLSKDAPTTEEQAASNIHSEKTLPASLQPAPTSPAETCAEAFSEVETCTPPSQEESTPACVQPESDQIAEAPRADEHSSHEALPESHTEPKTNNLIFGTREEAFQHFVAVVLPSITEEVTETEIYGRDAAAIADPGLREAVQMAWEAEYRFPQTFSKEVAAIATKVGLHIFKHEKKYLHVTGTRPVPIADDLNQLSPGIRKIVNILRQRKQCERPKLLDLILGDSPRLEADAMENFKASLASDLRWLIGAGHVIEFSGGLLHLVEARKASQPNPEQKAESTPKSKSSVRQSQSTPEPATGPETQTSLNAHDPKTLPDPNPEPTSQQSPQSDLGELNQLPETSATIDLSASVPSERIEESQMESPLSSTEQMAQPNATSSCENDNTAPVQSLEMATQHAPMPTETAVPKEQHDQIIEAATSPSDAGNDPQSTNLASSQMSCSDRCS